VPETLFIKDFSAGWTPSDDVVNGRPNAMLQMDNLELDKNGALQLIGGTRVKQSGFPATAHTLFSRYINGTRHDYSALTNGSVWRDNTSIMIGGDSQNAAFGTAFNFTLICSGNSRWKDTGTTLENLGVTPVGVPSVAGNDTCFTHFIPHLSNIVVPPGQGSATASGSLLQLTTNSSGVAIVQSYNVAGIPFNYTQLTGASNSGTMLDTDIVYILLNNFYLASDGFQIDFLLDVPNATGDQVSDYYSYNTGSGGGANQVSVDIFATGIQLKIQRGMFTRYGTATGLSWSTVYGVRISFSTTRVAPQTLSIGVEAGGIAFKGGTATPLGIWDYALMGVNNTGSYLAKSVLGPVLSNINTQDYYTITKLAWAAPSDPQITEVWIFRRNAAAGGSIGGLNQWYRVGVVPVGTTTFWDNTLDQTALNLDITVNPNLVSITASSITDKIYDIVGPIEGRWYYFTTNFMYPSDINDPDLVDTSLAVRTSGSSSELIMWARAVSAAVVVVGTNVDCYLLTGTFTTFPDNTIDIYYQSLGVKFPPITYDAVSYGGAVYYISSDGWRMVMPTSFGTTYANQNNQLIVAPNLDRLYNGEVCYGYSPANLQIAPGSIRYPVTIGQNKLWCFITGTSRCEVYDFVRQYWRTFNYNLGDATAVTATQDGQILAFYGDLKTREIGIQGNKLVDNTTQQTINLLLPYKDNGKPRQRKDTYTFKSRCFTGQGSFTVRLIDENNASYSIGTITSGSVITEKFLDASQAIGQNRPKSYQIAISGQSSDFSIEDFSIDYDARPIPLTFLRIYPSNMGSATQKRLRTWPLVIDTLGNNVVFTPDVDGVQQASTTFNTTYKKTVFHFFTTDIFGTDYGGTLYDSAGLMEVWDNGITSGGLSPDIVQNLPIAHEFDQVGPIEIFRYGKIARMALRTMSQGTPIPFKIYIGDTATYTGNFNVNPGKEDEYVVDLPKGVSGTIMRIELGPCGFTFNRYYMKFQVAISGAQKDTELQWITYPGITSQLAGGI